MSRNRIKSLIALPAMAGVLLLTACQASGGGTIPSASCGTGRAPAMPATFGFTFQGSDAQGFPAVGTFTGTYRDSGACGFRGGVALRGTGHPVPPESPPLGPPTTGFAGAFFVDYESTNPVYPGTGQFLVFVSDSGVHGPASTEGDSFTLSVLSGPYGPSDQNPAGYSNGGIVEHGNITVLQGQQFTP
jgi:hypothetical protein